MFSFFKRNRISINSVSIPDFGWKKIREDKSIIQWINSEENITISIMFFELPPDIPTMNNIEVLRNFYRQLICNVNGGVIEVELSKKDKMSFIKTIFKLPQEHSGMGYIASLTLPFKNCSFVFKIQAVEIGMTGLRDIVVAEKLLLTNTISIDENGYTNWFADPYDEYFKNRVLMNKSEQIIYDNDFPEHPLTQARQILNQISNGLQWKPELEKIPAFDK
jgi:hypothetical protein